MSFILEALKKSDKKRRAIDLPGLETEHAAATPSSRRSLWLPLLLLVLLLNCGIMLWVFGPWKAAAPEVKQAAMPEQQRQPIRRADPVVATTVEPAPEPAVTQTRAPAAVKTAAAATEEKSQQMKPQRKAKTPQEDHVYLLSELPASVQNSLPELHISLHAFNRAAQDSSMVRVNDQILRPGTELADKYLLEEVTADGAVFRFQGYRFLVPR